MVNIRTHATIVQRHEAVGNFVLTHAGQLSLLVYTGTWFALSYYFNITQKGAIFLIFDNFFFRWNIKL